MAFTHPPARWLRLGLLCAVLASASAGAAVQSWQTRYDEARAAYATGDLPLAEQAGRAALEQARAGGGGNQPFVASSLNLLALVRQRQGRADEAAALLREALAVSEGTADGAANSAALALNLGHALEALGRPDEALAAYGRALGHAQAPTARTDGAAARQQALQALARLHAALGQDEQAARYNRQLLEGEPGASPAMQADALERQAQWQQRQGDLGAARQSLERALALREGLSPPDSEGLLRSLAGLADVLGRMGLHDAAEPLHRRAVALLEQSDPQGAALAGHLNELGLWHWQRKEYPAAQALLERAQAIIGARAPQGLELARITANLAQLHEARGDTAQAQALYRQALAIYEAHGDLPEALLGRAQALNFLAGLDYRRRRIAQAEAQFLRALALTEQAGGPRSPRLLPLLDNLVTLYRGQGRPAQAAPYAERAEQLRKEGPGVGADSS